MNKKLVIAAHLAVAAAETTDDAATGDAATGDAATGDAATGDAATGDAAAGATGDDAAAGGDGAAAGGDGAAAGGDGAAAGGDGDAAAEGSDSDEKRGDWREKLADGTIDPNGAIFCDIGEDAFWESAKDKYGKLKERETQVLADIAAKKDEFEGLEGTYNAMKTAAGDAADGADATGHAAEIATYLANFVAARAKVLELVNASAGLDETTAK
jgi:hypothetical protein